MQNLSGKQLSDVYIHGWKAGIKTFYYLRAMGASQIEKSTLDAKKFGFTQKRSAVVTAPVEQQVTVAPVEEPVTGKACGVDEDCESCQ